MMYQTSYSVALELGMDSCYCNMTQYLIALQRNSKNHTVLVLVCSKFVIILKINDSGTSFDCQQVNF